MARDSCGLNENRKSRPTISTTARVCKINTGYAIQKSREDIFVASLHRWKYE
jgi:hypothetical protein